MPSTSVPFPSIGGTSPLKESISQYPSESHTQTLTSEPTPPRTSKISHSSSSGESYDTISSGTLQTPGSSPPKLIFKNRSRGLGSAAPVLQPASAPPIRTFLSVENPPISYEAITSSEWATTKQTCVYFLNYMKEGHELKAQEKLRQLFRIVIPCQPDDLMALSRRGEPCVVVDYHSFQEVKPLPGGKKYQDTTINVVVRDMYNRSKSPTKNRIPCVDDIGMPDVGLNDMNESKTGFECPDISIFISNCKPNIVSSFSKKNRPSSSSQTPSVNTESSTSSRKRKIEEEDTLVRPIYETQWTVRALECEIKPQNALKALCQLLGYMLVCFETNAAIYGLTLVGSRFSRIVRIDAGSTPEVPTFIIETNKKDLHTTERQLHTIAADFDVTYLAHRLDSQDNSSVSRTPSTSIPERLVPQSHDGSLPDAVSSMTSDLATSSPVAQLSLNDSATWDGLDRPAAHLLIKYICDIGQLGSRFERDQAPSLVEVQQRLRVSTTNLPGFRGFLNVVPNCLPLSSNPTATEDTVERSRAQPARFIAAKARSTALGDVYDSLYPENPIKTKNKGIKQGSKHSQGDGGGGEGSSRSPPGDSTPEDFSRDPELDQGGGQGGGGEATSHDAGRFTGNRGEVRHEAAAESPQDNFDKSDAVDLSLTASPLFPRGASVFSPLQRDNATGHSEDQAQADSEEESLPFRSECTTPEGSEACDLPGNDSHSLLDRAAFMHSPSYKAVANIRIQFCSPDIMNTILDRSLSVPVTNQSPVVQLASHRSPVFIRNDEVIEPSSPTSSVGSSKPLAAHEMPGVGYMGNLIEQL